MTPDSSNGDLREDLAGAICDATGLRGVVWAVVSDVADEYALADAVMPVVEAETAQLRAELAAQSATVDDTALIEQSALALASGNVGDAKYRHDDAVDVHEQVYGPLLAAKDVEIQRLRAELADITNTAWEDRESRIKEADQIRADLAERTRERDERFRSVVHQCCEDVQTLRAELAAKDAVIERTGARRAELFIELGQARTELEKARTQMSALIRENGRLNTYNRSMIELANEARAEVTELRGQQVGPLTRAWRGQIADTVDFFYGSQANLINKLCELVESWRPATEPAEATEPEMAGGPQWWRVTCCEAGQVAYPGPCPWHGTEGHPARAATEPADARRLDEPLRPSFWEPLNRDADGWCTCVGHQELKRQYTEGGDRG